MKPNPRLRLPYDPDTEDIWKYYKVIKITPIVIDKLLVILLTIPIIDSTLELNIYRVHNLAICMMGQALYPMMHITWCIYALFLEDEAQVQWDCKYEVKPFLDNRAQSLGRYMWNNNSYRLDAWRKPT